MKSGTSRTLRNKANSEAKLSSNKKIGNSKIQSKFQECPFCTKKFSNITKHIENMHPETEEISPLEEEDKSSILNSNPNSPPFEQNTETVTKFTNSQTPNLEKTLLILVGPSRVSF